MASGSKVIPFYGRGPKVKALRLSLSFDFTEDALACQRVLMVPATATFDELHTMIQACNNWMNYHLYDFELTLNGNKCIVRPAWEAEQDFDPDPNKQDLDSKKLKLSEVFPMQTHAEYHYDYGDGWEISIDFKETSTAPENSLPYCASGHGDVPPEDVGGEYGFEEFIRIRDDYEDGQHKEMLEWADGQGYERFSVDSCNDRLADWKKYQAIDDDEEDNKSSTSTSANKSSDADDYEQQRETVLAENNQYLTEFYEWLRAAGLSDKTINKHLDNVSFFLNTYVVDYRGFGDKLGSMKDGIRSVPDFLGDFFIRKCMWSTPATIRENAASFKKFYKCMEEKGHISKSELEQLKAIIKAGLDDWCDECARFNGNGSDSLWLW